MHGCGKDIEANQKFYFETWPPPSRIKVVADPNLCLDVDKDDKNLHVTVLKNSSESALPAPPGNQASGPKLLLGMGMSFSAARDERLRSREERTPGTRQ